MSIICRRGGIWLLAIAALVATGSGCAMCEHPYDHAYTYYGGAWQRDNYYRGRVGSILEPAGGPTHQAIPVGLSPTEAVLPKSASPVYE